MDQPARDRGPTYPATSGVDVDESFKRFLSDFYAVSDDADALARWLDSFSDDAIVLMGKDRAEGKSGRPGTASPACAGCASAGFR